MPTSTPSSSPSRTPPAPVSVFGTLDTNSAVCTASGSERESMKTAVQGEIEKATECGDTCKVDVTRVCGQDFSSRLLSTDERKLQASATVEYELILLVLCTGDGCTTDADAIEAANDQLRVLAGKLESSFDSGAFSKSLRENEVLIQVLGSEVECLLAWGTVNVIDPNIVDEAPGGGASGKLTNATNLFYPDWDGKDLTCLRDGNEPGYMRMNPSSWMYGTIEACCTRYYYGWNYQQCLGSNGSGLWHVDFLDQKCVTDCPKEAGPLCGGFAPTEESLFDSALSCCTSMLGWLYSEYCESQSLLNTCYVGTGKWYRGAQDNQCVKDCVPAKHPTCGGIVAEDWVPLYEDASECCNSEFDWQVNDMCVSRSTVNTTAKYYADWKTHKCINDAETPTEDVSLELYDNAESCCTTEISWERLEICVAATMGTVAQGSSDWYVDWKKLKCSKDCEGSAPCGGVAQSYTQRYATSSECCAMINPHDRSECILK